MAQHLAAQLTRQHHLNNSRSQRIPWALEELGIPYEIKYYQRRPDQLAPKELLDVHPLGKSPVITDTDRNVTVAESGAILHHLIKYYGNGNGKPSEANEDENVYWDQFAEATFVPTLVMKTIFSFLPTQTPFFIRPLVNMISGKVMQMYLDPDMTRKIRFIGDALEKKGNSGRVWFAGGDKDGGPTSADYQMLIPLEGITSGRMPTEEPVPESIKAWVDMVHSRPAYRRTYEKGGTYDYAKI